MLPTVPYLSPPVFPDYWYPVQDTLLAPTGESFAKKNTVRLLQLKHLPSSGAPVAEKSRTSLYRRQFAEDEILINYTLRRRIET